MRKVRVAAVSFLNTKPFLYGIEHSEIKNEIELTINHPNAIGQQLMKGQVDLGLVPVIIVPSLADPQIVSDYGIACDGTVESVVICSQVPIQHADRIFLDYQSKTSAFLVRLLLKEYWKAPSVRIVDASPGYEKQVMGKYAGLFIGDRAFKYKERYDFVYDIGEAWKNFTGKPFVFAAWVANQQLPPDFTGKFNEALKYGADHLSEVIAEQQPGYPGVNVRRYLSESIRYLIDEDKKEAMNYFLNLTNQEEKISLKI